MAFLHRQSPECLKSELDLFALPPTQSSIIDGINIHYKPVSSLSGDNPIEFVVPGGGDSYLDLSYTLLHLTVKVTNNDGKPLKTPSEVIPVNAWMHSLFPRLISF